MYPARTVPPTSTMNAPRRPHAFDPRVQRALQEVRSASIEFTRAYHAMHRAAPAEAARRRADAEQAEARLRKAEEIAARLARESSPE